MTLHIPTTSRIAAAALISFVPLFMLSGCTVISLKPDEGKPVKWCSTKIADRGPHKIAPDGWMIEFQPGGNFYWLMDSGTHVAYEDRGKYRIIDDLLILRTNAELSLDYKPEGFRSRFSMPDEDTLLLENTVHDHTITFKKCDAPQEALAKLPLPPHSLESAIQLLNEILPPEEIEKLRELEENDLGNLHHGFGGFVRNAFGLWNNNTALLESCGSAEMHPDDASMVVIRKYWESLQK